MRKIMIAIAALGLAGGAQAAGMCAGKLICIPGVPGSGCSAGLADLAVRASELKTMAAAQTAAIEPAPAPGSETEALRAGRRPQVSGKR